MPIKGNLAQKLFLGNYMYNEIYVVEYYQTTF